MNELKYALELGIEVAVTELSNGEFEVVWNDGKSVYITDKQEVIELGLVAAESEMTEEEIMKEWAKSGETAFVATANSSEKIKTSKGRKAKSTTSETVVNDLALLNGLGSEFKVGAVMRLQHFLRNAKLGKVVDYDLSLGNKGDIVGRVIGTDGTATLRQYVYLTPNGNEAWRMKVIQGN